MVIFLFIIFLFPTLRGAQLGKPLPETNGEAVVMAVHTKPLCFPMVSPPRHPGAQPWLRLQPGFH